MKLDVRRIGSAGVMELYLNALPDHRTDPARQAERLFEAIEQQARSRQGRIWRQRVFVPDGCLEAYQRAWQSVHGPAAPAIASSWLRAGPSMAGGVQAHAVVGLADGAPLADDAGGIGGWTWKSGRTQWAVTRGLCVPRTGDDGKSTAEAFEAAERLLGQAGMGLHDVARTWFFLDDILDWYDDFNAARTSLFRGRGLLGLNGAAGQVPASTGIGVTPACGSRLALEVFAVRGADDCIVRRPAAGRQRSAYEYGSAFARAAAASTPAGRTVFVSGTAAIDAQGRSCFSGDAAGQIQMTLDNVLAVLSDMGSAPDAVVQATAYCKTPAVAARFIEGFQGQRPWPWVVVVGDICRDDLLFEAEATACAPLAGDAGGQAEVPRP